jgi:hypothetical protein
MSYTDVAHVQVINNFRGRANITLTHQYSDDPAQEQPWSNVAPGTAGSPPLDAGYNTGFLRTGQDHWGIRVEVLEGVDKGLWVIYSKQCTLSKEDSDKTLPFSVSSSGWVLTEHSGTCNSGWDEHP